MLEQVREPGAPGPLIQRADVIPQVDGDEGQPVVLMRDHRKTVWQRVLLELDLRQLLRSLAPRILCTKHNRCNEKPQTSS